MVAHHTHDNLGFAFSCQAIAGEWADRCKSQAKGEVNEWMESKPTVWQVSRWAV